jgi:hypothetical protein
MGYQLRFDTCDKGRYDVRLETVGPVDGATSVVATFFMTSNTTNLAQPRTAMI